MPETLYFENNGKLREFLNNLNWIESKHKIEGEFLFDISVFTDIHLNTQNNKYYESKWDYRGVVKNNIFY